MKFTGKVKNGKLTMDDLDLFQNYLYELEGYVSIELKKEKKIRSPQQNAYYRVIVRILGRDLGYTEHEMHNELKSKFGIESTKNLTSQEFGEYIDHVIRWAVTEMGIVLPDPTKPHE